MTDSFETEMIRLINEIGEPVTIFYEPRNEGMEWLVGLEKTPMIHEHFASVNEGLAWLAKHKDRFDEWRDQIKLTTP